MNVNDPADTEFEPPSPFEVLIDQEELRVEFNNLTDRMISMPAYRGTGIMEVFRTGLQLVKMRREFWMNYVREQNNV